MSKRSKGENMFRPAYGFGKRSTIPATAPAEEFYDGYDAEDEDEYYIDI